MITLSVEVTITVRLGAGEMKTSLIQFGKQNACICFAQTLFLFAVIKSPVSYSALSLRYP